MQRSIEDKLLEPDYFEKVQKKKFWTAVFLFFLAAILHYFTE